MDYDEAFYHQLMLEAGITDKYTATLDHLLEIEDPLSDIVLELSSSGSDINKAISCLRNYTLDKTIDYNAVFDMVLEHLRRKYFDRELTIEELTDAMSIIAVNSGKWQDEPWYACTACSVGAAWLNAPTGRRGCRSDRRPTRDCSRSPANRVRR